MVNKSRQSGFGLVEVMVSITIMVMVMIALHYLSRNAFYNWENANNKVVTYNLIQKKIEELHNIRDTNANSPNTAGEPWHRGIEESEESKTINNRVYTTTVTISDVSNGPASDTKKKVTLVIRWQERLGERSLTGITYLTDWKAKY